MIMKLLAPLLIWILPITVCGWVCSHPGAPYAIRVGGAIYVFLALASMALTAAASVDDD